MFCVKTCLPHTADPTTLRRSSRSPSSSGPDASEHLLLIPSTSQAVRSDGQFSIQVAGELHQGDYEDNEVLMGVPSGAMDWSIAINRRKDP